MKNLIIIGAGGFGREVFNLSISTKEFKESYIVKGFIDDNLNALEGFNNYPNILAMIDNYEIVNNDVFICAISNSEIRQKVITKFKNKNAEFINLIHPSVRIYSNTILGEGIIIADNSTISCDCIIGDFSIIHSFVCIGHDVKIDNFSNIYSYVFLAGNTKVGTHVNLYPKCSISPNLIIGDYSTIGSCSLVLKNVKKSQTMFGIPAVNLKI